MKFSVEHHTEDYRGDHGADVVVCYEVGEEETVGSMIRRILRRPVDSIVIRRFRPDGAVNDGGERTPFPKEGE